MTKSTDIPGIRNITVSGRIGSGQTTLANKLAESLQWEILEGGALFAKIHEQLHLSEEDAEARPDKFDLEYEEHVKKMLREKEHQVIQSHLAGFDAQGIDGVFKILVVCEDGQGNDKQEIRIDRLVNRRGISVEDAKQEVRERERQHLEKFRRLYVHGDPDWVYWNKAYYDLVINTFTHNQEETLRLALEAIHIR